MLTMGPAGRASSQGFCMRSVSSLASRVANNSVSTTPSGLRPGFLVSCVPPLASGRFCSRRARGGGAGIFSCSKAKAGQISSIGHRRHLNSNFRLRPARRLRPFPTNIQSSTYLLSVLFASFAIGTGMVLLLRRSSPNQNTQDSGLPDDLDVIMPIESAPGRPDNLTPEQEEKLRGMWQLILRLCGIEDEEGPDVTVSNTNGTPTETTDSGDAKKKRKRSLFSRKTKKEGNSEPASPSGILSLRKEGGDDDKYGQVKQFNVTISSQTPEAIRQSIWSMVKYDHPDALVLRFLRARKWDVERALIMMISTMNWRKTEMKVDDEILKRGEAGFVEAENSSDPEIKKQGAGFMEQLRKGMSFVHGTDKDGRPVCFVRVRLHKEGEHPEEALEKCTVFLIETCRMLLTPPADTANIVFDMTGFSMANMDYTPVKFMIKCFEANYPESLGVVLVHKAPWIFQGIWKIIRGWLDPVVANKVHFTNNVKEMSEFIPVTHLLSELEGEDDWKYKYVGPAPGENDKMKDSETRDRLLAARDQLYKQYEELTSHWIREFEGEKGAELKARRHALAKQIRDDYWRVDPYIRARSYYDRTGVLLPGGKVNLCSSAQANRGAQPATTPDVAATLSEDVD